MVGWRAFCGSTLLVLAVLFTLASSLRTPALHRREALAAAGAAAASLLTPEHAMSTDGSLMARIKERRFDKPIFSLPPQEAAYPDWMEGTWDVTAGFGGYLFPSKTVKKEAVVSNEYTPGFKQLSIMSNADIGPPAAAFQQRFARRGGGGSAVRDDRPFNLSAAMRGWLGDRAPAVLSCEYEPERNPNRCSFALRPAAAAGARAGAGNTRVELFTNARETEAAGADAFLLSEYIRQVTIYRPGADVIARELVADYQQFWVYRRGGEEGGGGGGRGFKASLLTCGYLQPQDSNYFDSPTEPVVLYSHAYDFKPAAAGAA
ncbi:hypothetical protein JKP88DRAFT_329126 [Tribonema minus]|uniref:DUF6816 domain-containing protein n=1 Tax=Tribonema minus TaxID=303371 RepID=A0A835YQ42_9STRA|nr:hypothetical protein JKP88DRAFT_329126 [Tribonema minus]